MSIAGRRECFTGGETVDGFNWRFNKYVYKVGN